MKTGPENEGDLGLGAADWTCRETCERSKQLLGTVHGIKAGSCGEKWNVTTSTEHLLEQEPSEKESGRMAGSWNRGHSETGLGTAEGGGDKADGLTHGRTHIRCSWSRSCRPSAHGQRRRFLWSYRPPCGNLRRPACQTPAPER